MLRREPRMTAGIVIACVAVFPVQACVIEGRHPVFSVDNDAGVGLTIYRGVARDVRVVAAGPGVTSPVPIGRVGDDGCSLAPDYVAVADDGRATVPRRVCDRDICRIGSADLRR